MSNKWENKENLKKMQQDAIKRVKQMQLQAKEKILDLPSSSLPSPSSHPCPDKNQDNQKEQDLNPHNSKPKIKFKGKRSTLNDILNFSTSDNEKNLILMLILLLIDEKVDYGLILSLMYLIM